MPRVGSIVVDFTANTAKYQAGVDVIRKQNQFVTDSMKKAATETQTSYEKAMASIKGNFGKKTALFETFEVLRGGGAAAGIGLIGHELADATAKAIELRDQFREGKVSFGELVEKSAGLIPVYGELWQTGRNIHELYTGEAAAAADITKEAQAADVATAAMAERLKVSSEWTRKTADYMADVEAQIKRLSLSGLPLRMFDVDESAHKEIARIFDDAKKAKDTLAVSDASAKIADLKKQIAALPSTTERLNYVDPDTHDWAKRPTQHYQYLSQQLKQAQAQMKAAEKTIDQEAIKQANETARKAIYDRGQAIVEAAGAKVKALTDPWFAARDKNAEQVQRDKDAAQPPQEGYSKEAARLQNELKLKQISQSEYIVLELAAWEKAYGGVADKAKAANEATDRWQEKTTKLAAANKKIIDDYIKANPHGTLSGLASGLVAGFTGKQQPAAAAQTYEPPDVEERINTFANPSMGTDTAMDQNDALKDTINKGVDKIELALTGLTSAITKDPIGFLMTITAGKP